MSASTPGASAGLTIREVAKRTGVAAGTLRMWESRYGFPRPERLPSGHRRYSEADVDLVRDVERDRLAGMSLRAAIERAESAAGQAEPSIFAALRRRRPDLTPYLLPKRTLIGLSHAIEDECCARAERPLLFGAFQEERFYRAAERRWREFARTAEACLVFADFPRPRSPRGAPVELPIDRSDPLAREWALVCDAPGYSACLAAWERPMPAETKDHDRLFEAIWTVDGGVVRESARIAAGLAAKADAKVGSQLAGRLEEPAGGHDPVLVAALASRMVAYIGRSDFTPPPAPWSS